MQQAIDQPDTRMPSTLGKIAARARRVPREPVCAYSRNTLLLNDARPGTIRRVGVAHDIEPDSDNLGTWGIFAAIAHLGVRWWPYAAFALLILAAIATTVQAMDAPAHLGRSVH